MITKPEPSLLPQLVAMVHELNAQEAFHTPFCPQSFEAIQKELTSALDEDRLVVYEQDDTIQGVLVYFVASLGRADLLGPWVLKGNVEIAQALVLTVKSRLNNAKLQFFFHRDSAYYLSLMDRLSAQKEAYEYHLKCVKAQFKPSMSALTLSRAEAKDQQTLLTMHAQLFKDSYLTPEMMVSPARYDHLVFLEKNGHYLGFALLIPRGKEAYLEVFGILKDYQHQGYGKQFLSLLLREAFDQRGFDALTLIVEVDNTAALNLYRGVGFQVTQSLVSYVLH